MVLVNENFEGMWQPELDFPISNVSGRAELKLLQNHFHPFQFKL